VCVCVCVCVHLHRAVLRHIDPFLFGMKRVVSANEKKKRGQRRSKRRSPRRWYVPRGLEAAGPTCFWPLLARRLGAHSGASSPAAAPRESTGTPECPGRSVLEVH